MKVEVIGGGIAGLAVASALQRRGAEVTVRERQADATQNGSGLSLFGNGFAALRTLGLDDAVRAAAGPSPAHPSGLRLPQGRWISRLSMQALTELRIIERQRLHDVLHGALRPGTVHFGESVGEAAGSSTVAAEADLVVAADGIRSTLRRGWAKDPGTRYAGYFAFRAITAEPIPLEASGETWGAGRRFGIAPLADGRVYWFATVNGPRDHPPPTELAHLRELFDGWHDPIPALLDTTSAEAISVLPIDELGGCPAPLWRDKVVLVGDAAHAMTPNLGQGANLALEDAAVLTSLLEPYAGQTTPEPEEIRGVLASYDRHRSARVRALWRRSRQVGGIGQWANPVAVRIRDNLLAALPDGPANAASVKLQAWTPEVGGHLANPSGADST